MTNSHATTASSSASFPPAANAGAFSAPANKALAIGITALAATLAGLFLSILSNNTHAFALAYLVGLTFWIAISIGVLLWILLHHIFDASWSVTLRRLFENWLPNFKWLALLFLPLVIVSWIHPATVWPWMDPSTPLHGASGTVGTDIIYQKKSGFLNREWFTGAYIVFFALWIWLSSRLRKASFAQDADGNTRWTFENRFTAGMGIPIMGITLTFASIYWIKSLEYHWFSTMYGVWFFANCARGALPLGVLLMLWLHWRGDYKGILNTNHLYSAGQLMFAFTVFWAYIAFSQYFLIWNANIPEETFWYNLREINTNGAFNQWGWVGMVLIFGHFLVPFLYLLSYKNKITPARIAPIAVWILAIVLIDLCYNALPALRDAHDNPQPFLSLNLIWVVTTVVGVGGICVWAYLRSLSAHKLIPIRDPRIQECLTYHE